MTNIVMLVRDRFRLTEQALRSLYDNAPREEFTLFVVDDGSQDFRTRRLLDSLAHKSNARVSTMSNSGHRLSDLRNIGVYCSECIFGRGDYLYFSDNDIWFGPDWLQRMTSIPHEDNFILGGCQHPYHHAITDAKVLRYVDAVAGYSMLMPWAVWDRVGPFRGDAPGVGQSEDWDFCQRAKEQGCVVAYIHPPAVLHCGITNSKGDPAVGSEHFYRTTDKAVIYE